MTGLSEQQRAEIRAAAVRAVEAHPSTTFMAPCESLADAVLDAVLPVLLTAVRVERDAEIISWLGKKAREYRSTGSAQHRLQADAVDVMASKIARGVVPSTSEQAPVTAATASLVWRAEYPEGALALGHYTGRDAAMAHVRQVLADEENTTAAEIEKRTRWMADDPHAPEGEPTAWECWLVDADGDDEQATGYVVTPIDVAAAYDPDGES